MKIQAINNTNFKGLFTDKTAENGYNWRMEYRPYSWESNNTSKMANKKQIDIFAYDLPDNEEIYISYPNAGESSKDILGTESYYVRSDGKMRRTITEMPALNREESLKVKNSKLEEFERIKKIKAANMQNNMEKIYEKLRPSSDEFNKYYEDSSQGYFSRQYSLDNSRYNMKTEFNKTQNCAKDLYSDFQKYITLRNSIDNIKNIQMNNYKEIIKLGELRKAGNLIDISQRDIPNPDRALEEALQNLQSAAQKFVCLPHKLVSMEEILNTLGRAIEVPQNRNVILNYIKNLIRG